MPLLKTSLAVKNLRVLIIDDMKGNRTQIERQLKNLGFTKIDQAPGIIEAVEKMQQTPYDILLLDWQLPVGNGLDLLKACRQDPNYDNMAIVMASSESASASVVEALKAGATAYIIKPAPDTVMTEHMQKVMEWLEPRRA
jgi:two-component system chemotaxis response regulator CheY